MLFREQMARELDAKSGDFKEYLQRLETDVAFYRTMVEKLAATQPSEIQLLLDANTDAAAGLSSEFSESGSLDRAFDIHWANHEQARLWAMNVLERRTTFAADGSQIYAAKQTSVPIAAIQVGWFENPHDETRVYEKGGRFEILTPADLFRGQDDVMNPDIRVEERRYLGEVERITQFLEKHRGWGQRGERMPVAFFDNPLLVPFSQKGLQNSFLRATVDLVRCSQETGVPVVGYVDRSFARDLISLLDKVGEGRKDPSESLYDAALIFRLQETSWGNRTCFFYSRRRGLEAFNDPGSGLSSIGFCYLQTSMQSAPARLDVPSWVYEAGLLNEVTDVVRAECVVGVGYPYSLESADQAAVISGRDREAFFRALQEFAYREKLEFSVSRKDESKQRRR